MSLFDPLGVPVDSFSYLTSVKNAPVSRSGFSDDLCRILQDDASDVAIETSAEPGSDLGYPEEIPPETQESDIVAPSDDAFLPLGNPDPDGVGEPIPERTQGSTDPVAISSVPESDSSGTGTSDLSASS